MLPALERREAGDSIVFASAQEVEEAKMNMAGLRDQVIAQMLQLQRNVDGFSTAEGPLPYGDTHISLRLHVWDRTPLGDDQIRTDVKKLVENGGGFTLSVLATKDYQEYLDCEFKLSAFPTFKYRETGGKREGQVDEDHSQATAKVGGKYGASREEIFFDPDMQRAVYGKVSDMLTNALVLLRSQQASVPLFR